MIFKDPLNATCGNLTFRDMMNEGNKHKSNVESVPLLNLHDSILTEFNAYGDEDS